MPLSVNPIAAWNLNLGHNDAMGSHDFTTVIGSTINTDDQHIGAGCAELDGVNDHARMELPSAFKSANVTYAAWIKPDNPTHTGHVLVGNPKGAGTDGRGFGLIIKDGKVRAFLGTGDGGFEAVTGTTLLSTTEYHLIGATYDGANLRVFANDKYEAVLAEARGIEWDDKVGSFGPDPAQFYMGGSRNATAGVAANQGFYKGLIDAPSIFDSALSYGGVSVGQVAGGDWAELFNGGVGLEFPLGVIGNRRRRIMQMNRLRDY